MSQSRQDFANVLEGMHLLNRYIIDEFSLNPINKVTPFSGEPEFATQAYICVGLCWAERANNCLTDVEEREMQALNWRKEEVMGTDYWIFQQK